MASAPKKPPLTQRLLERAHSPTTAAQIHATKFVHKPLHLLPTTSKDSKPVTAGIKSSNKPTVPTTGLPDARTLRQQQRKAQLLEKQNKRKKGKGSKAGKVKPLSAAEKRKLCLYEIPKEEQKYELYKGLNELWCGYIQDILGLNNSSYAYVLGASGGAILASADFHGAEVEVVRSRCVGRVGTRGIVVRDTKFTFVVVTKGNEIRTIPKEHTIFRFEVPLAHKAKVETKSNDDVATRDVNMANSELDHDTASSGAQTIDQTPKARNLIFELHGEQFKNRAPDRANKKFKMHLSDDL